MKFSFALVPAAAAVFALSITPAAMAKSEKRSERLTSYSQPYAYEPGAQMNSHGFADPSFGDRAGIDNARVNGRCVVDLGYGATNTATDQTIKEEPTLGSSAGSSVLQVRQVAWSGWRTEPGDNYGDSKHPAKGAIGADSSDCKRLNRVGLNPWQLRLLDHASSHSAIMVPEQR